jgi:hypothetical protein
MMSGLFTKIETFFIGDRGYSFDYERKDFGGIDTA